MSTPEQDRLLAEDYANLMDVEAVTDMDPQALGIAFAMLQTGFSEADVVSVLGYMPNLDTAAADLDELERRIVEDRE